MKAIGDILKFTALALGFASECGLANAQNVAPPNAAPATIKAAPVAQNTSKNTIDTWQSLTAAQKVALQPLSTVWNSLTEAHKRKWLALSGNFAQLSEQDKVTMYGRMTEWASLSPKQREQARINFAQTKKLSPDDKQTKWQAYQALSPEEKQKLASKNAATHTPGAAPVIKPVPKDKLVTTPAQANTNTLKPDTSNKAPKRAVINNSASTASTAAPLNHVNPVNSSAVVVPSPNPSGKTADAR
jgi:hypothetical protein